MINGKLSFFSLVMIFLLILTSCSNENSKEAANSSDITASSPVVGEDEISTSIDGESPGVVGDETQLPPLPGELPDIPTVDFGPGNAWFQPTDPSQIQLASGRVQVFKFSASW